MTEVTWNVGDRVQFPFKGRVLFGTVEATNSSGFVLVKSDVPAPGAGGATVLALRPQGLAALPERPA